MEESQNCFNKKIEIYSSQLNKIFELRVKFENILSKPESSKIQNLFSNFTLDLKICSDLAQGFNQIYKDDKFSNFDFLIKFSIEHMSR